MTGNAPATHTPATIYIDGAWFGRYHVTRYQGTDYPDIPTYHQDFGSYEEALNAAFDLDRNAPVRHGQPGCSTFGHRFR